jgi:hypothetical protein
MSKLSILPVSSSTTLFDDTVGACHVAARPAEACHQPLPDWINTNYEHNRNARICIPCDSRRTVAADVTMTAGLRRTKSAAGFKNRRAREFASVASGPWFSRR